MTWKKMGLIYQCPQNLWWRKSHAQLPIARFVGDRLRIYFSTRDNQNRSRPTFIEVDPDNPPDVLYEHDAPLMSLGLPGTFDDCGVVFSSLYEDFNGKLCAYYVGWTTGGSVPYHLAAGTATKLEDSELFERSSPGPLMGRSSIEPYWVGPVVEAYRLMFYVSCVGWWEYAGRMEPSCVIRVSRPHALSSEAIVPMRWTLGAQTRPTVMWHNDRYRMWWSERALEDYRTNPARAYRIYYAESFDGTKWSTPHMVLEPSNRGWDSEMVAYPWVYWHRDRLYMLYNGNGFGQGGIGYAVWE
jgi:hypothetical protein